MIRPVIINILRLLLLVFLQLFVLNHIQFSGYVNPYLYLLFILWLPFETPGWLTIILAFLLGMVIDVASHTIGYHTIATTFVGYARFHFLQLIAPRDGYEPGMSPTASSLGLSWFIKYISILVIIHHFILFGVEAFGMGNYLAAAFRAIASSVFTILLILVCQFLTIRSR
ncbi:MAG: rod shape-determining protein MreD [Bacteroidales bacterium]|jgi:rod shape-determining protein MreD|nr:rod shape-determining protein MreD [Bacteroidales bacterium]